MPRYADPSVPLPTGAPRRLADFDYASTDVAFFVTICARRGTRPFTDERLASEVVASLEWLRAHRGTRIYAYCLMSDHLHLLLRLGSESMTLGTLLGTMKSFTTKKSWALGHTGALWQGRFYDHILRVNEDAPAIIVYIIENPVRKGLVEEASAYRWSGTPDPW
jgi:putative transposase